MRNVLLVLLGFGLLVLQTAVAALVPMHAYAPNLVLPIAIYLGVSPDVHVVRGAVLCFILGYLLDGFCGSPMGLQTFTLVAAYFSIRATALRMLPEGLGGRMLLTFGMALLTGATVLALRGIFESREFLLDDLGRSGMLILQSAAATALCGPPILSATRRLDAVLSQRAEHRSATI